MNREEEDRFAWALMDAAPSFLDDCARSWLCAKLGAGEAQSVVLDLLAGFARSGTVLPTALAASLWSWANGYSGSEAESSIREIVAKVELVSGSGQSDLPMAKLVARRSESTRLTTLVLVPTAR